VLSVTHSLGQSVSRQKNSVRALRLANTHHNFNLTCLCSDVTIYRITIADRGGIFQPPSQLVHLHLKLTHSLHLLSSPLAKYVIGNAIAHEGSYVQKMDWPEPKTFGYLKVAIVAQPPNSPCTLSSSHSKDFAW
jgi:hypothetical protein